MTLPNIIYKILNRNISIRAAHITDIHLKNNATCNNRLPAFTGSLLAKPLDAIINTGDTLDWPTNTEMGMLASLVAELKTKNVPLIVSRGNHDAAANNEQLGMIDTVNQHYYYDIDVWRFIVLYSQGGGNYSLGADQLTWLQNTLAATPSNKYVCIVSHVTILGVAAMMWYLRAGGTWQSTTDHHSDTVAILNVLKQYPNVKVCLSGHQHTIDEVVHEGITYLCSGAVSADWWNSNTYEEKGYPAGYRLIDFYKDGSIRHKFITY
jgi:Icc protein